MSKLTPIKALFGYTKVPDEIFLNRLKAAYAGTSGNPAFPNPPIDMKTFKVDIDSYETSVIDARDGSKKALVAKRKKREALMKSYRLLGRYVEIMCKDDMTIFLSSGFEAASTTRTPAQPLPQASILKIDQGNSGQLLIYIKVLKRARNYDVRYAPVPPASVSATAPSTWTTATFPSARTAAPIYNLTPGTNYVFQVRAYGKLGYSDWSAPVTRVCA